MGNPPPLRVETSALNWDPAVVTVPPMPVVPPGPDPMSAMIAAIMPGLSAPLTAAVAATQAREEQFAANLAAARTTYEGTDQANQQEIHTVADTQMAPTAASAASGGGGQMGQVMGTAMQVASQAAQAPAQVFGMAAQAPQAVMGAGQGALQQIGQLAGQFGKSEDAGGQSSVRELPDSETKEQEQNGQLEPEAREQSSAEASERKGADTGVTTSERAPDVGASEPGPQSRSYPVESDPVDL
ncbi:PE domain-containing protein [Mycolicibacterium austroafricanum]|uniref:PE domain-containing protein n=1 Tax=Mycolicibacterium austroafricanum TaxID=39687 RepID=UPI0023508BCF|nr:PE domain-containing protein [Mycolicibacterium austroafricanum]